MKKYRNLREGLDESGTPDMKYYAFDWDDNIMYMPTKIILKDEEGEALIYNNLSSVESQKGDTVKAIKYLQKAISINRRLESFCDLSYSYEGMGDLYVGKNILDSAQYYLNEAIRLGEICQDKTLLSSAYKNLGLLFKKRGDKKKCNQKPK